MKTCMCIIAFGCCCLLAIAQTKYEVTANTFLNIRSYASASAPVLGTIDKGGEVEVYEITNGWAKIRYDEGYAYVSAQYLKKVESEEVSSFSNKSIFNFSSWKLGDGGAEWMVLVIASLSLVLFFIRLNRGEDDPLEGNLHVTNWIVFLTLSIVELIYLALMGNDAVWFCMPDTVGWVWTVIDFLLFGFIVFNQFICFFNTLRDVMYNSGGGFGINWGLYSWIGGVIATVVCAIFFPPVLFFVGLAFLTCQIIQIVLIFKGVVPYGGWGQAFLCFAIYTLGSLATVLMLAHFILLLIIVLVTLFALYIVSKFSSQSSQRRCRTCNHYSFGHCSRNNRYINNADTTYCDGYE